MKAITNLSDGQHIHRINKTGKLFNEQTRCTEIDKQNNKIMEEIQHIQDRKVCANFKVAEGARAKVFAKPISNPYKRNMELEEGKDVIKAGYNIKQKMLTARVDTQKLIMDENKKMLDKILNVNLGVIDRGEIKQRKKKLKGLNRMISGSVTKNSTFDRATSLAHMHKLSHKGSMMKTEDCVGAGADGSKAELEKERQTKNASVAEPERKSE